MISDGINALAQFFQFFVQGSLLSLKKVFVFLVIVISVIVVDSQLGFTKNFNISRKLENLEKIDHQLSKTSDSSYKAILLKMRAELVSEKGFINNRPFHDTESWRFRLSYSLIGIVMIFLLAVTNLWNKKISIYERWKGFLPASLMVLACVFVFYWVALGLSHIIRPTWLLYLINYLGHAVLIVVVASYFIKLAENKYR